MNVSDLKVNDRVRLQTGVGSAAAQRLTYVVTKLNKTTIDLTPENGGRPARVDAMLVDKVNSDSGAVVTEVGMDYFENMLTLGDVVTVELRSTRTSIVPGSFYVVIAIKADTYNLAKLGGDNDRYLKNIRRSQMTKVDTSTWKTD